eukprot:scaffold5873_cov172-Amphora_coffeaeformis.AAC.7
MDPIPRGVADQSKFGNEKKNEGAGAWYYYENRDNGTSFDKYDAEAWNEKKKAEFEKSKK